MCGIQEPGLKTKKHHAVVANVVQLPSTEDGEGFLKNIWFTNMSVDEEFDVIFGMLLLFFFLFRNRN